MLSQVFGSSGCIDFWITLGQSTTEDRPDVGWGAELLRDGDEAEEHAARFAEGGKYAVMPMSHYALIDFRQTRQQLRHSKPGFAHVTFEADFTTAQLKYGDTTKSIHLAQ
jgi:hypothetical protein